MPPERIAALEVPDTLVAWGELARAHVRAWRRERPEARLVAVTGTAGKTTTKEICAALLGSAGPCHATAGNLNNRVGVPSVAFGLEVGHHFAVFEVGMSVPGEIDALARLLEPDVAILTNVGLAHAAGVGGARADVAREKGALFASLGPGGVAVACFDDAAALGQLARTRARRAITFGARDGADYRLVGRRQAGGSSTEVSILRRRDGSEVSFRLPVVGEAAAIDATAALAAVEAVTGALDSSAIAAALALVRSPPGRMQVRLLKSGTTVLDDSYNANPQSVRASLQTLMELTQGSSARRAVVILGEMRELGPRAAEEHAAVGAAIARAGVRVVVSCGGLADLAAIAAADAGVHAVRTVDTEEAAAIARTLLAPGDVVLVKASRGVGAERVVQAIVGEGGGDAEPLDGSA